MTNNPYMKERYAMKALRLKWPDARVVNQNFNLEFHVEFPNGEFGYAGFVNGPLECDLYKDSKALAEGDTYDSVEVDGMFDRIPMNYEDTWIVDSQSIAYNESAGMAVVLNSGVGGTYALEVMIDRGEEVCAVSDDIDVLKEAAMNYMYMLDAATGIDNLIDAPGILLHPLTMEYQLTNYDDSNGFGFNWFPKRPFNELLDILYGTSK